MELHTGLSRVNIDNEVRRYIAVPGQACAYKIGQLEITCVQGRAGDESLACRLPRHDMSCDVISFHLMAGPGLHCTQAVTQACAGAAGGQVRCARVPRHGALQRARAHDRAVRAGRRLHR
jgi:hypothetical protein